MRKNVGLLIFNDKPLKKAHIVFSTRNLTKSITEITKTPPRPDSTIGTINPKPLERPCLLSSHGLCCGHPGSLKPGRFQHTLNLLPLTVCTKHGKAGFLPLDRVRRMGEYTRTTCRYPILKVVHSFDDCILEFPHPPPIGSSDSKLDYSGKCYQCLADLSHRRTVHMYR